VPDFNKVKLVVVVNQIGQLEHPALNRLILAGA
jgi:hypothetical protein